MQPIVLGLGGGQLRAPEDLDATGLVWDEVNKRLGVGTLAPTVTLDVNGAVKSTGLTLSGFTAGSVLFAGGLGVVTQDNANLFWDDAQNFLGIGVAAPLARLHVKGPAVSAFLEDPAAAGSAQLILGVNGAAKSSAIVYDAALNTLNVVPDAAASLQLRAGAGAGNTVQFFSGAISTLRGSVADTGHLTWLRRIQQKQGADVASANNLTLGSDGNVFVITGVTQINLIESANWQDGSMVSLIFSGGLTLKENQAPAGTFLPMLLTGAADVLVADNRTIDFILCTKGGTRAWRQWAPVVSL